MKKKKLLLAWLCIILLTGCQKENDDMTATNGEKDSPSGIKVEMVTESETTEENPSSPPEAEEMNHAVPPAKEQVIAKREAVLEGMTVEQIERLAENIKVANMRMEHAYLYDNIFKKLEDENSLYWNYFDKKGDIQIGWSYDGTTSEIKAICDKENLSVDEFYQQYGTPVMAYNRFDADNFIELIKEMQESVQNEMLWADLQHLMEETALARDTHKVEHADNIYKILHDMDYYLFRYGIDDVGKYAKDVSTISKYYGVLVVYQE